MSNATFPASIPGVDIAITRETIYATTVQVSPSGKEQRAAWQSTPRYKFTVKLNFLRDDVYAATQGSWSTYSELDAIQKLYDDHRGQWDSFSFTDPVDGTSRTVRFAEDTYTVTRLADKVFEATITLVTVK